MLNTPLHRLNETHIQSVTKQDGSWSIEFSNGDSLEILCLWRLLEDNLISSTSEDHDKDFGWKQRFDGVIALSALADKTIVNVSMLPETGDIGIKFENETILQVVPVSAGLVSWRFIQSDGSGFIAKSGQLHPL